MGCASPPLLVPLLLLAAVCALLPAPAAGQQPMPFQGHGDNPPASPVDVYVTAYVDRILAVDDRQYEFTAVVWFYLSWVDPRVKGQIAENAAKLANETANYKCDTPCQSNQKTVAGGCCDGIWAPYIAFSNLKFLPQDRVVRYGLGFDPDTDAVFQWRSVHATYYTPMDLRAFPFDRQQLLIQMEVPQARNGWSGGLLNLIPSTTGTSLFTAKTGGDDVSGWGVSTVRLVPFQYPLCQATMDGALGPSAATDPYPVMPQFMWDHKVGGGQEEGNEASTCSDVLLATPERGARSPFWRNPLTNASSGSVKQEPIPVSGLNCIILVQRFTTRWVLSAIFPIMATTWLGFLVFFLPRDDMNGRLGSIVALFLALAAIQFVVDQDVPASSYITPLQQLTLASYLSLILVGFECVVIWYLTTYHVEKVKARRHLEAQRSYQAKLTAIKSAIDAWMVKAQATYRRSPSRSNSAGKGLGWGSVSIKKASAAATPEPTSPGPGDLTRLRSAPAGGAADHNPKAAAAAAAFAAGAGARAAARDGTGGDLRAAPDATVKQSGVLSSSSAAAEGPGSSKLSVTPAPDSPAGEVRLVVGGAPGTTAAGGGSSSNASGNGPTTASSSRARRQLDPEISTGSGTNDQQQQQQQPHQWEESVALAGAAAAAAMAAAELAASEAEAAHPGPGGVHHRTGLLRFMRAQDTPSSHAPASDDLDTAAAAADGGGSSDAAAVTAAAQQQQQQQQQQPKGSAGGAGGLGQLVTDLMAAQGKDVSSGGQQQQQQRDKSSGGGSNGGSKAAAATASGGGAGGERPRTDVVENLMKKLQRRGMAGDSWHARSRQRLLLFVEAIYSDEGFADRVAHKCNKWCAITQWVMYNAAAVLIFAVNSYVHRVR